MDQTTTFVKVCLTLLKPIFLQSVRKIFSFYLKIGHLIGYAANKYIVSAGMFSVKKLKEKEHFHVIL